MTRERAIEVLKAWDLNWSDEFTANEFEQAFAMAISALSDYDKMQEISLDLAFENDELINKSRWIPVSERLPEKNVWVLVTVEQNGNRYQEIMRRHNYIEAWTDNIDNYTDGITAWMPLPETYNAEKGGE